MLLLLRVIQHAGDEYTQELFADCDIGSEHFIALDDADTKRIVAIKSALNCIADNTLVPKRLIDRALTEAQRADIRSCCNQPTSFELDYKPQDFPLQFVRYLNYVQQGDRYTALAQSARKRKSVKRDARGRTAAQRYSDLAETSYESAVMELTDLLEPTQGMPFDHQQAGMIRMVLDREVDCSIGNEPNPDAVCVPRLKTSKSQYAIKNDIATTSKHEHLQRCQRDALIPVALELLYGKQEAPATTSSTQEQSALLKQKLNQLRKIAD